MIRLLLLLSATICVSHTWGPLGLYAHVDAEGHVTCDTDDYDIQYDGKRPARGNLSLVYKSFSQDGNIRDNKVLSSVKVSDKTGRYRIHGRTFLPHRLRKSVFELQLSYSCTKNDQPLKDTVVEVPTNYFAYEVPGKQNETKVFRHDFDS